MTLNLEVKQGVLSAKSWIDKVLSQPSEPSEPSKPSEPSEPEQPPGCNQSHLLVFVGLRGVRGPNMMSTESIPVLPLFGGLPFEFYEIPLLASQGAVHARGQTDAATTAPEVMDIVTSTIAALIAPIMHAPNRIRSALAWEPTEIAIATIAAFTAPTIGAKSA